MGSALVANVAVSVDGDEEGAGGHDIWALRNELRGLGLDTSGGRPFSQQMPLITQGTPCKPACA